MTHHTKIALALAIVGLGNVAAHAAEIVLYENPGFSGRQVELYDFTPSISRVGFNDRSSSAVVRSGRWEVCTDDGFKGFCAILEPGEYRKLDGRLNDRISSLREVGATEGRSHREREMTGSVELFNKTGFGGNSMKLERDITDFNSAGMNDRAMSLVVNDGTWILCTDANYRGTCRTYGPGRYADLGYGMTRAISSAHMVAGNTDYQPVHRGGYGRPPENVETTPIAMYEGENLAGRSLAVSNNIVDLGPIGFNDTAASMVITTGYWEFCSDAYFRGQCRVMGPGQYRRLDPVLARSISSVRAAAEAPAPVLGNHHAEVEMFTAPNFAGQRVTVNNDMVNFDAGGFNDKFNSVVVNAGTWEICFDANYRGGCTSFGPGRYAFIGALSNQVSSMRRVY